MQQLQPNTFLQGGKYKIQRVLGQGGFGITYLAEHTLLDTQVAVKEFFLKDFCKRDGNTSSVAIGIESNAEFVERYRQKFLKEAKMIYKLRHPNIVSIVDIFTENETAYYVMDYVEGTSLNDMVSQKGALPESTAIEYIKEVANALAYIHEQKVNHLDIKPANIMVKANGRGVVLIDFGLSKQYDTETGSQTSTTPVGISHGYAPIEQYRQGGVSEFSPQTDIYSLGATLYKLVTGVTPPEASLLLNEDEELVRPNDVSFSTWCAIEKAMEPRRKKRPQTISDFLELWKDDVTMLDYSVKNRKGEPTGGDWIESEDKTILITENTYPELVREEIQAVLPKEIEFCLKYGLRAEGKETVDLGLSVLWGSCNIGAKCPASSGTLESWAKVKITDCLDWRLPSTEEYKELKDKCNWKWIDENGICGYLITSPITANSIFLRASGKDDGGQTSNTDIGFYWSGSLSSSTANAYCTTFMPSTILCYIQNPLGLKMSMRLVR